MGNLLKNIWDGFLNGISWLSNILVKAEFDWLNNLFSYSILQLRETPEQFGGVGATLIETIKTISSTFIMPIAGIIITFCFTYSLIELTLQKNNMNDFNLSALFELVIKTTINIIVVTNAFTFLQALFNLGTTLISNVTNETTVFETAKILENFQNMDNGQAVLFFLTSLIMVFVGLICVAMILLTIWSRVVSIYILMALAPIPLATLLQNGWVSGIGQSFLKLLVAYALQGFIIMLVIKIIGTAISSFTFGSGVDALIKINIMVGVCAMTVMKSLQLSKSIMNVA